MAIKVSGTTVIDDSRNFKNLVNINGTGNVYANTFIGDGSQLSNLPAGGSSVDLVASGTLTDGTTVIVNTDGTVSSISSTVYVDGVTSNTILSTAGSSAIQGCYDPDSNKVVVAYADNDDSYKGKAVVGTISGGSISFGSATVFNDNSASGEMLGSGDLLAMDIAYNKFEDKVVVVYKQSTGNWPAARVGTVSGTSISFGSQQYFQYSNCIGFSVTCEPTTGKVLVAYQNFGNSSYGTAIVGTISGTSISFGTSVVFESAATYSITSSFHEAQKQHVIVYGDGGNSDLGTAITATISGTTPSFGTATVFGNGRDVYWMDSTYDSTSQKIIIAYQQSNVSGQPGGAIVATVTGSSISFGSEATFTTNNVQYVGISYSPISNKVVIGYQDAGSSNKPTAVTGTVSGTDISFATPVALQSAGIHNGNAVIGDESTSGSGQFVIVYRYSSPQDTVATLYQPSYTDTNLTTGNYIGISSDAYANGATATIQTVGAVDDAQSGLTPGELYYVQANGSIATTADSAGPSVIAGLALTSTTLAVKGQ